MKNKDEEIQTCRHFRFLIPQEDANELRSLDKDPCIICDNKDLRLDIRNLLTNLQKIKLETI